MPLLADPSLIYGSSGNALPYTLLNHYPTSPSSTSFTVDCSNYLMTYLQIWNVGGTSSATGTVLFQVFSTPDNVWYDTYSYYPPYAIPTVANTISRQSFTLSTGKYTVALTNTDPYNNVNVMATSGNVW